MGRGLRELRLERLDDAVERGGHLDRVGLYKTELIDRHHRSWSGRAEVERETAAWVQRYNAARLHSSLGHRPPVEFEQHYRSSTEVTSAVEVA